MNRIKYIEPFVMIATLLRWFFLASITGGVVGTATSFFLKGLFYSSNKTANIPLWIQMILLPVGGILNGLLIYYGYHNSSSKSDSTIVAVHQQNGIMPYKTIGIKPLAAIITLAFGGSAGKEGPCSHIGGTLGSLIGRLFQLNPELQKKILVCGVSAGFASVFGTPIAGAIYGIEVLIIGRLRHDFIFPAVIAGVTSYEVSKLWGIPYINYPLHMSPVFSEALFFRIILIGLLCGLISWLFIEILEEISLLFRLIQQRFHIWIPLMPFLGGLILSAIIILVPTDYLGLSLPLMDHALRGGSVPYIGIFWKFLFVAITLGSGFYGGIVTPQFVIGAMSGNVFCNLFGVNPMLGAAVGMVSVVASASNTPIAAVFMGFELFGSTAGIYIVGACITAYMVIGHRSVYPNQLVAYRKSQWLHLEPGIELGNENIHISYGLLRKLISWERRHYRR